MELKKMKPLLDTEPEKEENVEEIKPPKRRNPFNTQRLKEEKERRQKKRARLIVRNISYKSTDDALREHFGQWGTLEDVHILKRGDGKLVGCAFVQYETINQATKAIMMANGKELLGRKVFVDWAIGKDEYSAKHPKEEPAEKKPKVEVKEESDNEDEGVESENENDVSDEESEGDAEAEDNEGHDDDDDDVEDGDEDEDEDEDEDKKDIKSDIENVKREKHISNDVQQGCTVFIKNVPFDAEDNDLRKVCRKFGLVHYAIINRESVSGHSKGTAFVKFKAKESADLCLQAGTEFKLNDEVLDPHPALSRDEIKSKHSEKSKDEGKDSRNLYLAREGLIMANSKAADGVSASDMARRHELEQVKTQVLKNLNRFVSRNRLSIHNLPMNYDNEKMKQMALTYTGFRPHECRVMREQKVTPEHPQGKSKGFGFLSFDTHQRALTALRKLNNNPSIFGAQHRPIVAFSIEDRAVHRIKEKRNERSKQNNPTYKTKLEQRKQRREEKRKGQKPTSTTIAPQDDNKVKLQKHIKKLETARAAKAEGKLQKQEKQRSDVEGDYVGTAAKPGTSLRMRSKKKIMEQAQEHMKRVKTEKRKQKNKKIRETHLAERKANNRPKQGRKKEKDELRPLINRYKDMISGNEGGGGITGSSGKVKKPKRTKWYKD
ncbi:RNA-binding protein 28 [Drosophila albomicans]|uniref:RNA-binding protein 28 n=1 Tax=Drosophila albomicans TaxID=7291 RepID=A0A6P8X1G1_DROAB|nr:RNA-binding protein 28 [Drosophila albomicans]